MATGFQIRGRVSGNTPHYRDIVAKNTATYTKGDICNVETGELDIGAAADVALVGPVLETVAATDSVTLMKVCTSPDVILGVTDNNARLAGAPLDISGTTGAMGVTTSSSKTFIVYADSSATEETLVVFNNTHVFSHTQ